MKTRIGGRRVLDQLFQFYCTFESPGVLVTTQVAESTSSFSLGWGSRIFLSDKFPSDPKTAGLGSPLRNTGLYLKILKSLNNQLQIWIGN